MMIEKMQTRKLLIIINFVWFFIILRFYFYTEYHLGKTLETKFIKPEGHNDSETLNNDLRTNIYFVKTHKCASSTVQNILLRFGLLHNLNFLLPRDGSYIAYLKNVYDSDIYQNATTVDGKYNIFTHHAQYTDEIKNRIYADSVTVTILRDPASLFESLYDYYHLDKRYNISFEDLLKSLPNNVPDILYKNRDKFKYGFNQMSFDFRFKQENFKNDDAINALIEKIDREVDFVMITEHMEASLILLANLMRWPLHYVTYFTINSRTESQKYNLTEMDTAHLQELNYSDTLLYRYFLKKFKNRVKNYGTERLMTEINRLFNLNERLKQKCVKNENRRGYAGTINYDLKNDADWECVHIAKTEFKFTDELRVTQTNRLLPIKNLQKLMAESNEG